MLLFGAKWRYEMNCTNNGRNTVFIGKENKIPGERNKPLKTDLSINLNA
jgi:hypothetical protein